VSGTRPGQHVPAIGAGFNTQGMIAPTTLIVDSTGALNATGFRFLFNLLRQVSALEAKVATLTTRLQQANIP